MLQRPFALVWAIPLALSIALPSGAAEPALRPATTASAANSGSMDFPITRFTEQIGQGAFAAGIALGILLLFLVLLVNGLLQYARGKGSIAP